MGITLILAYLELYLFEEEKKLKKLIVFYIGKKLKI